MIVQSINNLDGKLFVNNLKFFIDFFDNYKTESLKLNTMSESKWTIINGVKYQNTDTDTRSDMDITYEYQTKGDVQKTTRNEIYFPNYIVSRDDEGKVSFKRRKLN